MAAVSSRTCEQPVVASFLFLSVSQSCSRVYMNRPQMELEKEKNGQEESWRGEKGREKINFPRQS